MKADPLRGSLVGGLAFSAKGERERERGQKYFACRARLIRVWQDSGSASALRISVLDGLRDTACPLFRSSVALIWTKSEATLTSRDLVFNRPSRLVYAADSAAVNCQPGTDAAPPMCMRSTGVLANMSICLTVRWLSAWRSSSHAL